MKRVLVASAVALALSGCAATAPVTPGTNPTPIQVTPTQVAADIALIASGLHNAVPLLVTPTASPGLSPATVQQVETIIADIQAAAMAFTTADTAVSQQAVATRIQTDITAIIAAIPAGAVPTQFAPYLAAASALVPVIEVALGMVLPAAQATAPSHMTPDQARLLLAAA